MDSINPVCITTTKAVKLQSTEVPNMAATRPLYCKPPLRSRESANTHGHTAWPFSCIPWAVQGRHTPIENSPIIRQRCHSPHVEPDSPFHHPAYCSPVCSVTALNWGLGAPYRQRLGAEIPTRSLSSVVSDPRSSLSGIVLCYRHPQRLTLRQPTYCTESASSTAVGTYGELRRHKVLHLSATLGATPK